MAAEGPGTGETLIPSSMARAVSSEPGSEMPGVPALVTRATSDPDCPQAAYRKSGNGRRRPGDRRNHNSFINGQSRKQRTRI